MRALTPHCHSRDYDLLQGPRQSWQFEPSYAGLAASKLGKPSAPGTPANLVDTMLCVNASMLSRRESIQMSHNPDMRAHVTDKITNTPHMPMYEPKLTRWPTRERWGVGILRWEGGCSIPCVPCGQQAQGALLGAQSREQLARQHTDCTSGADFTAVHSTG